MRGKKSELTWVGVGVTGSGVPDVIVVAYPDLPMQTNVPAWRLEQSVPTAGFQA